jgi:hypothetical protein
MWTSRVISVVNIKKIHIYKCKNKFDKRVIHDKIIVTPRVGGEGGNMKINVTEEGKKAILDKVSFKKDEKNVRIYVSGVG